MKKVFITILVLISIQTLGQKIKYAERLNANLTVDSFYQKQFTDSLFAYSNDAFICFTKEYYISLGIEMPNGFGNFILSTGGFYKNYSQRTEEVHWDGVVNKPLEVSNLSGTNTGDNATNTQYSGLAASKADINSPTFTGTVNGITKAMVGLPNADNTSDANKPISTATQTALNNKSTIHVGLDAGANDSYVVTLSPAPAAYTQGMVIMFRANTANTTGCTVNVNSLGVKTIVKRVSTTPATGDILALMWVWAIYDGTNFVILNPVVN